ncbi:MAG: DUF3696 domain-containing protein [Gammaproteobacteria bacterium]
MLKHLRIQNFKCWEDTGVMNMAPLTVFFGTNSSGKSSIGEFLMLLKQTAEFADRRAVLHLGDMNSAVELGTYEDMIYARDRSHDLEFDYEWDCKGQLDFQDSHSGKRYLYDAMHFSATIGLEAKAKRAMFVKRFRYHLENDADALDIRMSSKGNSTAKYTLNAEGYDLKREHGTAKPLEPPVHFYAFPDEAFARFKNVDFVADLNLQHQKLFASMFYLGPLRENAARVYSWSGAAPESVGLRGEHAVAAMLAAQTQKRIFNHGRGRTNLTFGQEIVEKLRRMGLANDLEVKPLSKDLQRVYEVRVATKYSKDRGNRRGDVLPDVGIGVAQVLPVLVQCFYAPAGSIIIMEQPEIHLHPSAQSALADVMIDAIYSREKHNDRNIQLIIETHSEHFLRRLQLRIAEGKIVREDVAAYYIEPGPARANLRPLDIDLFGSILNWPEDFFGNEMADILGLAKARRKHSRAQAQSGRR